MIALEIHPGSVRSVRRFRFKRQPFQRQVRRALQLKPAANHRPPLAHASDHDRLVRLAAKVFRHEIRHHRLRVAVQRHDRSRRNALGQRFWKGADGLRRRGRQASQSERPETAEYGRTTNASHPGNKSGSQNHHAGEPPPNSGTESCCRGPGFSFGDRRSATGIADLPREMSAPLWAAAFLRYDNARIGFGLRAEPFAQPRLTRSQRRRRVFGAPSPLAPG